MKTNHSTQDYTRWHLPEGSKARLGKGSITGNIAYSPDGTRLVVPSSIGIWIYDAHTLEEVGLITEHKMVGASVLVGWEPHGMITTTEYKSFDSSAIGFTLSGSLLASGFGPTWDDFHFGKLQIWDEDTRHSKDIWVSREDIGAITSLVFSPDGDTLAAGSTNGKINLWDVQTGELGNTLTEHTGIVSSLVFSPDGHTLAAGNKDGTVLLWNVGTAELLTTLTEQMWGLVFHPDSSLLAASLGQLPIGLDPWTKEMGLWDVHTGNRISIFYSGLTSSNLVFSPDGKMLACATVDRYDIRKIGLWDGDTSHLIYASGLSGHTSSIRYLAFSPDSRTLVSGSQDGTVLLWDVDTASMSVHTPNIIPDSNKSNDYYEYLKSDKWKKLRESILRRDNELCICGAKATEVHHKTYARLFCELPSDLVSLCRHCHQDVHDKYQIR